MTRHTAVQYKSTVFNFNLNITSSIPSLKLNYLKRFYLNSFTCTRIDNGVDLSTTIRALDLVIWFYFTW